MAFDPTKPANKSKLSSAEMREQLNSLKALIDAQQAQMAAMQAQVTSLNAKATAVAAIPANDLMISDPPGCDEMNTLYDKVKAIINGMKG